MSTGLTSSIDLVEVLFTLFWVFFIGLLIYLQRESKREGYPLESDRGGRVTVQGFPAIPKPKTFHLAHGGTALAPREEAPEDVAVTPAAPFPGAPMVPSGDPLVDGVGPAAYARRADTPDLTIDGDHRIVPTRVAPEFSIHARDAQLTGWPVRAADGVEVGTVRDVWVDRAEPQVFYVEVTRGGEGGGNVLVPLSFVDIRRGAGELRVNAIYSHQFDQVPALRAPDQITLREEDRICAFFAGGLLYADPARQEPLV